MASRAVSRLHVVKRALQDAALVEENEARDAFQTDGIVRIVALGALTQATITTAVSIIEGSAIGALRYTFSPKEKLSRSKAIATCASIREPEVTSPTRTVARNALRPHWSFAS